MSKFKKILREIAKKEGISTKEVYREMQLAIDKGFENPDPAVRLVWQNIPLRGARPTPEDVITYYAGKIHMEQKINN